MENLENAGYQHFLSFSHNVFLKVFFSSVYKSSDCVLRGQQAYQLFIINLYYKQKIFWILCTLKAFADNKISMPK